jgi:hypothetical protein
MDRPNLLVRLGRQKREDVACCFAFLHFPDGGPARPDAGKEGQRPGLSNANQTGGRVPSGSASFSEKLVKGTIQRLSTPSQRLLANPSIFRQDAPAPLPHSPRDTHQPARCALPLERFSSLAQMRPQLVSAVPPLLEHKRTCRCIVALCNWCRRDGNVSLAPLSLVTKVSLALAQPSLLIRYSQRIQVLRRRACIVHPIPE